LTHSPPTPGARIEGLRANPARLLRPRLTGLWNRWKFAERQEKGAYVLFILFGLGFWASLFGGLIYVVELFYQVEVFGPLLTRKLLELMVVALFGLLIFSNIVVALSTFYLSEDLELLLSLPVSPQAFFYTRFVDTLAQSGWMMVMFGVPVFLAFGLAAGAPWPYYATLAVVVPTYLALPAGFGAVTASVLVTVFPARRLRELLALVGLLFLVGLFILLRVLKPEQLLDPNSFESVAAYVATLQDPVPPLLPPAWAAEVLGASLQGRPYPWLHLGLLASSGIGLTGLARWISSRLYADGWSRSQEARGARFAKNPLFDNVLKTLTSTFTHDRAALVIKDAKVFVRDPAQWSQIFLLLALIVIYLFSVRAMPTQMFHGKLLTGFRNLLAFANIGGVGFVLSAIAVRFQFAAISGEGRAFWILRTAPLTAERYLWSKCLVGLTPMLFVGVTLSVVTNVLLESPLGLNVLSTITTVGMAVGIAGIAIGVGASYPDFKADNVARAASGPGAIVFMVLALAFVCLVVVVEALPVFYVLRASYEETALDARELGIVLLLQTATLIVCALAGALPIKRAAKGLWSRSL